MNAAALALSFLASIVVLACSADKQVAAPTPLRVGHTYVNGNCGLDSENKLTGLCQGGGKSGGCRGQKPDPDSPPCTVGVVVTESRTPACSAETAQDLVSREHQCFFVER